MAARLAEKVAIITGGSSGLGAATVDLFLKEGAHVLIADFQVEAGEHTARQSNGRARFVRADVTNEADIANMVEVAISAFGGVDILVNNAGSAGTLASIAEMDAEGWDAVMALLPRAAALGMKHAYPHIKARGSGSIINTASIAAMRPGIASVSYAVAKAGVLALTKMAAAEFAPDNIRVNAICPGIIPTQGISGFFGVSREKCDEMEPEVTKIFATAQPLKRAGTPRDIANTALFLASDEAAFTTGQDFVVDGGMLMMGPSSLEMNRPDGVMARMAELASRYRD